MAAALGRGDTTGFFRAVLSSPLYLPAVEAELVEEHARTLFSVEVHGTHYLVVFSSPEAAARVDGADTVVVTDYRELLANWPDPSWRLALNPGAPIDALVPPDAVIRAALEEVTLPLAAEVRAGGTVSGDATPVSRPSRRRAWLVAGSLVLVAGVVLAGLFASGVVRLGPTPPTTALGAPSYVEETTTAGIEQTYDGSETYDVGGGLAVLDCDDDGLPDV